MDLKQIFITAIGIVALIRHNEAAQPFWEGDDPARIRQETGYNRDIVRDRNPVLYVENNGGAEGQVISLRHVYRGRVVNLRYENRNRFLRQNRHSEVLLQNQEITLQYRLRQQLPDELKCTKCTINIRDAVIRECGHLIMCRHCLVRLDHCPRCWRRILAWNVVSWF
ncbi:E3 ubiquitin-protein ligase rnf8-like [Ruditapes philippinarum]|uniref:E3 ubiquitin-protein ligase rnf8-like n=1 Tax=Ruditapes philippinarum TaxID=129788 RepID=UPI00295B5C9E|nr:E3 ubiquitin-protein ligase rnf8-like [Ruditapes philippinarum]